MDSEVLILFLIEDRSVCFMLLYMEGVYTCVCMTSIQPIRYKREILLKPS
jgi:hypothetical protein